MATPQEVPRDAVRPDAVVRPLSRAAERPCSRPGCPAPARATMTFAYGQREAWVERLRERSEPQAYDLCSQHASRTRPPHGWTFKDRRPEEERRIDPPPVTPADLGGERTVAVLAAALRAVPDVAPERGDRPPPPTEDAPDDAGDAATASAPVDAPVAAGPMLASDPEDVPSLVLGADRASPASAPEAETDGPGARASATGEHTEYRAIDAQAGPVDAQAGPIDAQAGPIDAQAGPADAQAGPAEVQAGPDDVREGTDDVRDAPTAYAPTLDLEESAPVPRPPLAVRDAQHR